MNTPLLLLGIAVAVYVIFRACADVYRRHDLDDDEWENRQW